MKEKKKKKNKLFIKPKHIMRPTLSLNIKITHRGNYGEISYLGKMS